MVNSQLRKRKGWKRKAVKYNPCRAPSCQQILSAIASQLVPKPCTPKRIELKSFL